MRRWIYQALVAFDQFCNVLLGGNPDETISARSERAAERGDLLGKFMVWWLDKIQPNHGRGAVEGDLRRAEAVEKIEKEILGQK